jgi:hypothetical protein
MRFLILGNGEKKHVASCSERLAQAVVQAGGSVAAIDLTRSLDLSNVDADMRSSSVAMVRSCVHRGRWAIARCPFWA